MTLYAVYFLLCLDQAYYRVLLCVLSDGWIGYVLSFFVFFKQKPAYEI